MPPQQSKRRKVHGDDEGTLHEEGVEALLTFQQLGGGFFAGDSDYYQADLQQYCSDNNNNNYNNTNFNDLDNCSMSTQGTQISTVSRSSPSTTLDPQQQQRGKELLFFESRKMEGPNQHCRGFSSPPHHRHPPPFVELRDISNGLQTVKSSNCQPQSPLRSFSCNSTSSSSTSSHLPVSSFIPEQHLVVFPSTPTSTSRSSSVSHRAQRNTSTINNPNNIENKVVALTLGFGPNLPLSTLSSNKVEGNAIDNNSKLIDNNTNNNINSSKERPNAKSTADATMRQSTLTPKPPLSPLKFSHQKDHKLCAPSSAPPGLPHSEEPKLSSELKFSTPVPPPPTPPPPPTYPVFPQPEHFLERVVGLPPIVQKLYGEIRGIPKPYDWQMACLSSPNVLGGRNLIYSLPTSGGKTFVAEVLALKTLLVARKDVIIILPYVSIVEEKARDLAPFAERLNFYVEIYAGSRGKVPPVPKRNKWSTVYVATIEKANSLVNNLIQEKQLRKFGLVVVDELHMIDADTRGATLEVCLTKLLYVSDVQIVAMSATILNIGELAEFLSNAEVFSANFRPVTLNEFVKIENKLYSVSSLKRDEQTGTISLGEAVRVLPQKQGSKKNQDPTEQLVGLLAEVLPTKPVLVFCPSRDACEKLAPVLAKHLDPTIREHQAVDRAQLLKDLKEAGEGLCDKLKECVPYGIAYHHSGVTNDERKIIEDAYKAGTLSVLVCTSTLAAGVNLPAHRVIIRSPKMGYKMLTKSEYKQMCGRAGRAGYSGEGESILVLDNKNEQQAAFNILMDPLPSCKSALNLHDGRCSNSLVLSLICSGLAPNLKQICLFMRKTLLGIQDPECVASIVKDTLIHLVDKALIKPADLSDLNSLQPILVNPLGMAVYVSGLDTDKAHSIKKDLEGVLTNVILSNELHLLYIITPYDMVTTEQFDNAGYKRYLSAFNKLNADERRVGELLGIRAEYLERSIYGLGSRPSGPMLFKLRRFYLTLAIYDIVHHEKTIWEVSRLFNMTRGSLQALMNAASVFAACLVHFTHEIPELWALELLIDNFVKRLLFGVKRELVPLMELPGVKPGRARQLVCVGYTSLKLIATTTVQLMVDKLGGQISTRTAEVIIEGSKRLLRRQYEQMLDEAYMSVADLGDDPSPS